MRLTIEEQTPNELATPEGAAVARKLFAEALHHAGHVAKGGTGQNEHEHGHGFHGDGEIKVLRALETQIVDVWTRHAATLAGRVGAAVKGAVG